MKKQHKYLFLYLFFSQSCAIYSFSGVSLSKKVKTYSIQNFYVDTAKGPNNMYDLFTQELEKQIGQKTSLKKVDNEGDLLFEGKVIDFKYDPVNTDSNDTMARLSIKVSIDFFNMHDENMAFYNKKFTQSERVDNQNLNENEEEEITKKMFSALVKKILDASITNW